MSDNLNIEELFRSNLGSLEADVSPNAWSNIQQGLNAQTVASAAAAKTGLSFVAKSIILTTGIVAATIAGIYIFNEDQPQINSNEPVVLVDDNSVITDVQSNSLTEDINEELLNVDYTEENEQLNSQPDETNSTPAELDDFSNRVDITPNQQENEGGVSENGDIEKTNQENESGEGITDQENNTNDVNSQETDKTSAQKRLLVNPSYSIVNDQNEAPATYIFEANAENCSSVRWDFGDGTTGEGFDVEHVYEKPGKYKVQMIAKEGQQNMIKSMIINVETIAKISEVNSNIFSPNGDGLNDDYFIESENIEELAIIITDAKGNIIWKTNEIDFSWNGTDLGGNPLPAGNYSYVLVAVGTDGGNIERRGFITLQR